MPSFSSSSSIRVASQDHAVRLKITHNFFHGSPSDAVHRVKGRLPKGLDILWLSDITITFSGSLDGHQISSLDLARSGLVHHFRTRLKANADRLGLNDVSCPFVDDTDGLSKRRSLPFSLAPDSKLTFSVTLTPSRPLPSVSRPHTNLGSLHLAYIWMSVVPSDGDTVGPGHLVEKANPFASDLFLPAEALLNRVTEQFLVNHLVGRYPLIFGPWCRRLDLEMQYFPSITHSIVEIMTRSKNRGFVSKCKRLLKAARIQHQFVLEASAAALPSSTEDNASDTPQEEIDHVPAPPVLMDGRVLCESLEQLFRVGTPQRRFKPAATPQLVFLSQDDEDGLLESMLDERIDSEAAWTKQPGIATSPCTLLTDHPEDMSVFAQGEWSDDRMWCLFDVDANMADGLPATFEPQSEGSLIGTAISLASITTRSPQASTFTLYHHQDVADAAASGSCCNDLQFACLEDPGAWAPFQPSPLYVSHDRHCLENSEQVMQKLGTCQVGPESIASIGSPSEDAEIEDSDSILLDVDIAEFADMDGNPDWLV